MASTSDTILIHITKDLLGFFGGRSPDGRKLLSYELGESVGWADTVYGDDTWTQSEQIFVPAVHTAEDGGHLCYCRHNESVDPPLTWGQWHGHG